MSPPPVVHASWAMMFLSFALLLPPLVFIFIAKRGRQLYIRRIPGIDAIEEALGRATELGRPVVFTTGMTALDSLLFAILGILTHIGRKCASFGCRLIVPQRDYEVMPVVSETVREAFRAAGRIDAFNPQDIRFLSPEQFAFASGYMGICHREKAASCFLFGEFAAESLVLAETGQQVGAMQVAGTISYNQVPFFLTSCDYTIIGEEVYAAAAYLSREPAQLGSVRGQDVAKLIVLATILIGVIAATAASASRVDPREGIKYNSWFAKLLYRQPEQDVILASFEVKNAFEPPKAPSQEDLDSGTSSARPAARLPSDQEDDLGRIRARLARKAERARGILKRVSAQAKDLAGELRPQLALFAGTQDEGKAAEFAAILEQAAERSGKEAAEISGQLGARLAEVEKSIAAQSRARAAEMAKPELNTLDDWAADANKAIDLRCAKAIADARAALAGPADLEEISRKLRSARQACYDAWSMQARAYMQKAETAAKSQWIPRFLGDFQGGSVILLLDGTDAVSGRLLPLSHTWTVEPVPDPEKGETAEPAPDPNAKKELKGPQAPMTFAKPGFYDVTLKASEKPERPKAIILALLTNDPTDVRHETIAAGAEIKVSWRAPRTLVPDSDEYAWDLGDDSAKAKDRGKKLALSHKYEKAGSYLMTVEVKYRRKIVEDAAAVRMAAGGSEAGADPRLVELRQTLAAGLTDICDRLSEVDEWLVDARSEADSYKERLAAIAGLSDGVWPDKVLAGEMSDSLGKVRDWAAAQNKDLGKRLSAVQALGAAKVSAAKDAGAPGAAGPQAPAGKEESCWNRFRIYWKVVDPKEDSTKRTIEVKQAAPTLARAPWEPRPKPSEPAKDGPAAKEGGR